MAPSSAAVSDLGFRLREASSEELLRLVEEHAGEIGAPQMRQILANPYLTREVIESLLAIPGILNRYEVRRGLAVHPQTPEPRALRLVAGLFWRDLLAVGADTRVRPIVRRAAERSLVRRLPSLAVGEKMAIARRASAGVLAELRHDPSPRVMAAVLENPRLTEGTLLPLVHSDTVLPAILEVIAGNRRWGVRYSLRRGLARNPRTPTQTALRILPHLQKLDLRAIAADPRLASAVRKRAGLLLGEVV